MMNYLSKHNIYNAESFMIEQYKQAKDEGDLRSLILKGKDRKQVENARKRVLGYADTRDQILSTALLDDNHLLVQYLGDL